MIKSYREVIKEFSNEQNKKQVRRGFRLGALGALAGGALGAMGGGIPGALGGAALGGGIVTGIAHDVSAWRNRRRDKVRLSK
jgi:thiamine pyrophosphate-dependent acetolactate synthase large subunit-like protein